ncbi:hypothetical protein RCL1_008505 [Eukaryota sp. TZLM3-RCL]
MRLGLLLAFLACIAVISASNALTEDYGHTFLEYGVPMMGEFKKGLSVNYFYIDVSDGEKLTLAVDSKMPVELLLSQDPYPAAWNASWGGSSFFELGPADRNYFPGRFYIAARAFAEFAEEFTITGYSDVPMLEEIPTMGQIRASGYAFFSFPVCAAGTLTIESLFGSTVSGIYMSQQWAHPTKEFNSYKTESATKITVNLRSAGRMYVGVRGNAGESVGLIGKMDNEIETIEEFAEVSGSVIRGCVRHYRFEGVDETSRIPLTAIASENWKNSEIYLFLSHGEHNIFPDQYDYDDVTMLEVGGAAHFNAMEFIDGTAYLGVSAPDASLWIPNSYNFILSQHHMFIHEGYETIVTIPSTQTGALFVFTRIAEFPVRHVAAEVAFGDDRARDAFDYMIYGSHTDPQVEGAGSCVTAYGYMECHEEHDPGQQIRYFMRIVSSHAGDPGHAPEDINLLATLVYEVNLYEEYDSTVEKDEWEAFVIDIPEQYTGSDIIIQVDSKGTGYVEAFASFDRIPASHRNLHKWRSVPYGYLREITIPKEDLVFGQAATIYFSVRGISKSEYSIVVFTENRLPIPGGMRYRDYLAPMAVNHFFHIPEHNWHHDGSVLIFSIQAPPETPVAMYISSHHESPDETQHDWVVTPAGGALIVTADDPSYRHDMGTYFISILAQGPSSGVIEYSIVIDEVDPLVDNRVYVDFVSPAGVNLYLFKAVDFADVYLQIEAIKPIAAVSDAGSINTFVSSLDVPHAGSYEYKLSDLKYSDGTKTISMIHGDGVRGHQGAAAGTYLVSVTGHSMFNLYSLRLISSLNLDFNEATVGHSVFVNEYQLFNVRLTSEMYDQMKPKGYVTVQLAATGNYEASCISGLSLFVSDKNVHPSHHSGYAWGGILEQQVKIPHSELHAGRLFFSVYGQENSCAFNVVTTYVSGHSRAGAVFGWILFFILIAALLGGAAYAVVYFRQNPQKVPQWVPARFKQSQYDSL